MASPRFPAALMSKDLGLLRLQETPFDTFVSRYYEPERPPSVGAVDIQAILWPPKEGVPDPEALAAFFDRQYRAIRDAILAGSLQQRAIPVVAEAIAYFAPASDDYTPPTAEELLRTVTLEMIKINADGDHEVQFYDQADMVGSHDLLIQLNGRLEPVSAHFDG